MPDNFGFWGDLFARVATEAAGATIDHFGGSNPGSSNLAFPTASNGASNRADLVTPTVFGTDRDGTWDWNPFSDADDLPSGTNGHPCNLPVLVAPAQKVINKAPRGYVIVEDPMNPGQKVAMLKSVAKACGAWKPRAKPFFTASEAKTVRKAARLQKKGDRLAKMLNASCSGSPLRRSRGKR